MASIPSENTPLTETSKPATLPRHRAVSERASIADSFDAILQTTFQSSAKDAAAEKPAVEPLVEQPKSAEREDHAPELRDDSADVELEQAKDNSEPAETESRNDDVDDRSADEDARNEQDRNDGEASEQSEQQQEDNEENVQDVQVDSTEEVDQLQLAVVDVAQDVEVVEQQQVAEQELEIVDLAATEGEEDGDQQQTKIVVEEIDSTAKAKDDGGNENAAQSVQLDDGELEVDAEATSDDGVKIDSEGKQVKSSQKSQADSQVVETDTNQQAGNELDEAADAPSADSTSDHDAGRVRRGRRGNVQITAPQAENAEAPNVGSAKADASNAINGAQQSEKLGDRMIRASRASTSSEATRSAQQNRLLGRVTRAFQAAQLRGGGPLKIRLHPSELGSMKIELQVEQGVMTAKLEVETNAARSALLDSLPNLRERLEEQGISVEKFEVGLSTGGDQPQEELGEEQSDQPRNQAPTSDATDVPEETTTNSANAADGGLNVIV